MKKSFPIDIDIYLPVYIYQAIENYKDVAQINLEDDKLTITASSKKDIEEVFVEFMNYVLSLETQSISREHTFSQDDFSSINLEKIGHFRYKKFDSQTYLITNDIGKFHFLSSNNFMLFVQGKYQYIPAHEELIDKGFIKTNGYEEKLIETYRKKTSFIGLGPSLHMIVITLRCNHHCRYCHAAVAPENATEFDMSKETAKKVVDTILYTNSPSITIEFQGGEALLNWDVVQYVVEYATSQATYLRKQVNFTLVSNLTLMTEEKLTWLLKNRVDICTSLDGDETLHNGNRTGYKGNSYEKVTYWIKRINEEKPKVGMGKIGALLTTTKQILPEYKKLIDSYLELGLDGIFLRWLNPYGFAASDLDTLSYEPEEWIHFYEKSLDYIIELNKQGVEFREYITTVYLMKIFMDFDPAFMDIRSPSGIAVGGVAYNYDGKVYASDESRMLGRMGIEDFLMTEMKESGKETYESMMNSDIAKIAIQASTLDGLPGYNDHVYKPYLGVDIIHNFKMTGSVYTPLSIDKKAQIQIGILDVIFRKLGNPEESNILLSWLEKR